MKLLNEVFRKLLVGFINDWIDTVEVVSGLNNIVNIYAYGDTNRIGFKNEASLPSVSLLPSMRVDL